MKSSSRKAMKRSKTLKRKWRKTPWAKTRWSRPEKHRERREGALQHPVAAVVRDEEEKGRQDEQVEQVLYSSSQKSTLYLVMNTRP
mmetsp:Transcript_13704/g.19794  ORF Transcript_13704/g.19794 Transcript_13704/m.19794 type:complete len:86 (-) Transcript_13704:704-961(-)